jgi:ATP-binding cassette subfamily C protein LapB
MIPGQLIQWAHTKAALLGLDRIWTLQDDHHGAEHPLLPATINGNYRFEDVNPKSHHGLYRHAHF